jgi:raffinose/stachyose/melibiose transport system substrate-binding protein
MPDIFFTWSCAFLGDFVKEDKVYCLDDAYKGFADKLPEKMCKNTTYNGKKYGVPLTMNIVGLFANLDILKEVGYDDVPETYEKLIECCDKLVAAGKIPFGCAGKETWCVTEYLESIIEKSCGAKTLDDIFVNGATWDNQDVAKAVDIFQEMIKKGYFDPDGISLGNDDVKANFMAGKYAFYMNGTWNCGEFAAKEGFNVKVSEFPVIDGTKAKLGQLIGGPSDTLAVAKSAKDAENTAKYTLELGQLICKYGYLDGCGLPAWTVDYNADSVNALTKSVAEIVAKSDYMVLFGDTAMPADEAGKYLEQVAKVYGGEVDGAGFIAALKAAIR